MQSPVHPKNEVEILSAPGGLTKAVELLVDRAKIDRHGVFWPVGANYRQGSTTLFETSLGFGSPGILLTLLEYYSRTKEKEIAELIHKGLAWVTHRVQNSPLQHGYYTGTSGLWYLYRELEKVFPGAAGSWREQAVTALAEKKEGDFPASLTAGVAGTMVGAFCTLDLQPEEETALLRPLLDHLIAATKPTLEGVFWDFYPTSIRPPVGFSQGNAGVDYFLAYARHRWQRSYTPLLAGSLGYADSLFDSQIGNWLDQEAVGQLKQLQPSEIEKLIVRGDIDKLTRSIKAEDSLSWGTGTTGILLSRSLLALAYGHDHIGQQALTDCRRAVQRLSRVTEGDLAKLDSSLLHGLGGVVLGLQACRLLLPEAESAVIESVLQTARSLLAERQPVVEGDDLSLLSGVAGLAYSQLKSLSDQAEPNCVHPLAIAPIGPDGDSAVEGDLEPMLRRRLPASATVPEVRTALVTSVVSLSTVTAAVARQCQGDPTSVMTKSIQHEIGLYEAFARVRFQQLFWQELIKRSRFARNYAEGMDDNLLYERFCLDESVTLLDLDFDPYTHTAPQVPQRLFLLRHATSNGVIDGILSTLQHALLSGFREEAVTLEVIRTVIPRVETPNVTQRQLADLSLKMIRGFVNAGYLSPHSPNKIEAWLSRKRLNTVRNNLFPAAVT